MPPKIKIIETTKYPKIAMLWNSFRRGNSKKNIAKHGLLVVSPEKIGLKYNSNKKGLAEGFTKKSIKKSKNEISKIKKFNSNALILGEIYFYEYKENWLPKNHEWWLRIEGERKQFWPGTRKIDWKNKQYQNHVMKRISSLKESGVDGVFLDNIRNEEKILEPFFKKLRNKLGNGFLILINAGYSVGDLDFLAPYVNGFLYESGWSHKKEKLKNNLNKMIKTESLLRKPTISVIERFEDISHHAGWPNNPKRNKKIKRDTKARRWSLCYSLVVGDFYYLFSDNTGGHNHDWYSEYNLKIGLPKGKFKKISSSIFKREYEKAEVFVNLPCSNKIYKIKLKEKRKDSLTGKISNKFNLMPGDGCILLKL